MAIMNDKFLIETRGFNDMVDITVQVQKIIEKMGIKSAMVHVYCPGSTLGVFTVEYEPGLVKDIPEMLERIIPADMTYHHDETWHDGNGHSHVRSSLYRNSVTIPYNNGELELGQWQQIVLMDFDNRERTRSITVQALY